MTYGRTRMELSSQGRTHDPLDPMHCPGACRVLGNCRYAGHDRGHVTRTDRDDNTANGRHHHRSSGEYHCGPHDDDDYHHIDDYDHRPGRTGSGKGY